MLLKPAFNLSPSLLKTFFNNKTPSFLLNCSSYRSRPLKPINTITQFGFQPRKQSQRLCTAAAAAKSADEGATLVRKGRRQVSSLPQQSQMSGKAEKRARRESPSGILLSHLCRCSKENNTEEALRLYDEAVRNNVPLNVEHYNKLLYLCSSSDTNLALKRGFEIYKQMETGNNVTKVVPNEATFTTMARLAAAKEDPEMAFDLVKRMKEGCGISPRLRSYVPALSGFCKKGMADKAYEVDSYMIENGIAAEEGELAMLLQVSFDTKREDKVYEMLQRLRATVRQVSEDTASLVEDWFKSDCAVSVGKVKWDVGKLKEAVVKGGGGWHGQGWLGNGKWKVVRTEMNEKGVCQCCGEKLVSVDIDPLETENFATSLSNLACQRETRADFLQFQEWVQKHGPFDAVVENESRVFDSGENESVGKEFGLESRVLDCEENRSEFILCSRLAPESDSMESRFLDLVAENQTHVELGSKFGLDLEWNETHMEFEHDMELESDSMESSQVIEEGGPKYEPKSGLESECNQTHVGFDHSMELESNSMESSQMIEDLECNSIESSQLIEEGVPTYDPKSILDLKCNQTHVEFEHDVGLESNSIESSQAIKGNPKMETNIKQVDTTMAFLEWNMRTPLEIIYEAYEGEEEEYEDDEESNYNENHEVSNNKHDVGIERYPSLLMYYPDSETDSSSGDDFPMNEKWERHESVFFKWEDEEEEEREELIEISLDHYGKRSIEFCHVEEDNLIEIDLFN